MIFSLSVFNDKKIIKVIDYCMKVVANYYVNDSVGEFVENRRGVREIEIKFVIYVIVVARRIVFFEYLAKIL